MRKAHPFRRGTCVLLALALLSCVLLSACGGAHPKVAGYKVEENTNDKRTTYPYVVHTPSATWYLAADDIALMGEEAYFEGLAAILKDQEQDFADAREALKGYINEEIPAIDIYTDFSGRAAASESFGAYYNMRSDFIKLFGDWTMAAATLLHEYVHYLTVHCAPIPARPGFWAEAAANYFSMIACKDRMARSVDHGQSQEELAIYRAGGAWDEAEDCLDMQKFYYGTAYTFEQGWMVGIEFYSVSDVMEQRTEKLQQDPSIQHISHFEAASILAYLIETYSMDTVMASMDTDPDEIESVFGEPFSEIYRKWAVWNAAKCAELGLSFG